MSKTPVFDVDMRSSAKRPILEVEADSAPSWMPAMVAMINALINAMINACLGLSGEWIKLWVYIR